MKILVIGHRGSTGRRYSKILLDMGNDVIGYDIDEISKGYHIPSADRSIIATPTSTHIFYAQLMQDRGIPYLVEKPACATHYDVDSMTGHMVNNWCFVFPYTVLKPGSHTIIYRNSKTGNEGYWYDTCQLHILSNRTGSIIKRKGGFDTTVDGVRVTLDDIEESYVRMIRSWLLDDGNVWMISDIATELKWVLTQAERLIVL